MCRIYAVQGTEPAAPILLAGLKRLEYGGYDSAGIAIYDDGALHVRKTEGKVDLLVDLLNREQELQGTTGIAHTRWATNGPPSLLNAHPHKSWNGKISLVHNGVQDSENEKIQRERLLEHGIICQSDTDSEVIANIIALELQMGANNLEDAVERGLKHVEGAYALAIMGADYPNTVIGVRRSSPLSVGINGTSVYLSSDPIAFAGLAVHKVEMKDDELVTLADSTFKFRKGISHERVETYDVPAEHVSKGGYTTFLLKEIVEQPDSLRAVLSGRLRKDGLVRLGGIEKLEQRIAAAPRFVFTACGTAYHAATIGKDLIEDLAGIPVEVQYAHEFRTRVLTPNDVVIAVSQSGETMDTINAIREAKKKGALTLGINNRVGSTLSREVDAGIYLHAGPEISVASTKAFTAQVAVLVLLALRLAQVRGVGDKSHQARLARVLGEMPEKVYEALQTFNQMHAIAEIVAKAKTVLFLGRGYGMNLAPEGALKLQEIAYLNAQGRPGGELMHGFLALVEEGTPVIAVIGNDPHRAKMISSMQKVQSRGGHLYVIRSGEIDLPDGLAKEVITLPEVPEELLAIVAAIPLQILAHEVGTVLGLNVDQPRNLAKSVTVE